MATRMGRADRSVSLLRYILWPLIGSFCSYNWTPGLLPSERSSCSRCWCTRGPHKRAQASRYIVSIITRFSFFLAAAHVLPRSRDWVCPRCNRSNLECLPDPDPAQPNDSSTSGSASEVKTSAEAEVVHTPAEAEVMPPQPPQSEASISEREAISGGAGGAEDTTPDDTTTSVVASSHSSASNVPTSSQNIPDVRSGTRQAGPAPFRPSQTARRPPMLLDTAICVLLVLVFALLCRRIF
jgi:hypothetical protein